MGYLYLYHMCGSLWMMRWKEQRCEDIFLVISETMAGSHVASRPWFFHYVKVTRRPVLTRTVPFFDLLSLCPERFRWDASLSRFVENWNLVSIFVSLIFLIIIHRPIQTCLCQNSYLKFLCPKGAYYWWRRKFVQSNNQQDNAATYYPACIFSFSYNNFAICLW